MKDAARGPPPTNRRRSVSPTSQDALVPASSKNNERVVWLQRGGDKRARGCQGEIVGTGGPSLGDACCDGPGEAVEIWGDPGGGGGGVDDASIVTSGVSLKSAAN